MQFYSYISTVHLHIYYCGLPRKKCQVCSDSDCISSAIYSHYLTKSVSVLPVPMYIRSLYLNSTLYTESAAVLNMYFDQLCARCCKHLLLNWIDDHTLPFFILLHQHRLYNCHTVWLLMYNSG